MLWFCFIVFFFQPLVDKFKQLVAGFSDTLLSTRQVIPDRQCYKQEALVKDLLDQSYDAHDSMSDVRALVALTAAKLPTEVLLQHSITLQSSVTLVIARQKSKALLVMLRSKVPKDALTDGMADKISKSGLGYSDLLLAYQRQGDIGVARLLGEMSANGKVRVTKSKPVLAKLTKFLSSIPATATSACAPIVPALSAERLALFRCRLQEGYDNPLQDSVYEQWVKTQTA